MRKRRVRSFHLCAVGLLLLLLNPGCITLPHTAPPEPPPEKIAEKGPLQVFPDLCRGRALRYEKENDVRRALFMWQVVQAFAPDDLETEEKIDALEKQIRIAADDHFRRGEELLQKNSIQAARREWLMALAYDPEHKEALLGLWRLNRGPDSISYETTQGDSASKIAQKIYQDAGKDFIVAYFNDLGSQDAVRPGVILTLPVIEPEAGQTRQVREPRGKAIPAPRVIDKAGAEKHYGKGVRHYLAEEPAQAIKEWEETLRLDPGHPYARKDIERTRTLLNKIRSK